MRPLHLHRRISRCNMSLAPVINIAGMVSKPSLFEIHDHLSALFESLDGIEDPELRQQCENDIDLYLQAEVRKVDSITGYLAHMESQKQHAADEIKRLQARKQAAERTIERVEASVMRVMELWGLKKLEGRTSSLALRACPPSVEVVDQSAVPPGYLVTKVTESVDKMAAKVALVAGKIIPGLSLVTDRKSVVRR